MSEQKRNIDMWRKEIDEWLLNFEEEDRNSFHRGDRIGEGEYGPTEIFIAKGGEGAELQVTTQFSPQRKVVLKFKNYHPLSFLDNNKEIYRKFIEEAERWHRFSGSPHVVTLFHLLKYISPDTDQKNPGWMVSIGFVMEYSALGDLNKHILKLANHGYGSSELLNFLKQIAQAIQMGVMRRVVHCDIKPENVLLFSSPGMPFPKVMDFGISLNDGDNPTIVGRGTAQYMAPELWDSAQLPDYKSDIYSLGILMFEFLTGKRPFVISKTPEMTHEEEQKAYGELHRLSEPPIDELGYNNQLKLLIRGMLAKAPGKRPDIDNVIDGLESCISDIHAKAEDPNNDPAVRAKYYCWNPHIHTKLGDELRFYVLVMRNSQTGTSDLIYRLKAEKLFSYSLYRVLGGSDRILRLWVQPTGVAEIEKIVQETAEKYGILRVSKMQSHLGDASEIWKAKWEDKTAQDASIAILKCANKDRATEFKQLRDLELVLGVHDGEKEYPLRLFMTIIFAEARDEYALEAFAKKLKDRIQRKNTAQEISWYCGNGEVRAGVIQMLFKFRLQKFEDFRLVVSAFDELAAEHSAQFRVRSQTYVEIPPEALVQNDDGSVVLQVNRQREKMGKRVYPDKPPEN